MAHAKGLRRDGVGEPAVLMDRVKDDGKVVARGWAMARPSGADQPAGGIGTLLEGKDSNWGNFASTGYLVVVGYILGCHSLQEVEGRGRMLLAYSSTRSGMLLNIPKRPGPSSQKRMCRYQMLMVPRLREPGPKAGEVVRGFGVRD